MEVTLIDNWDSLSSTRHTSSETAQFQKSHYNYKNEKNTQPREESTASSQTDKLKWCPCHKSNKHDKSECRILKGGKNNPKDQKEKNLVIKEPIQYMLSVLQGYSGLYTHLCRSIYPLMQVHIPTYASLYTHLCKSIYPLVNFSLKLNFLD